MARFALWLGRKMDVEAFFLQRHNDWRYRLGAWLERYAWRLCAWGWDRGSR